MIWRASLRHWRSGKLEVKHFKHILIASAVVTVLAACGFTEDRTVRAYVGHPHPARWVMSVTKSPGRELSLLQSCAASPQLEPSVTDVNEWAYLS